MRLVGRAKKSDSDEDGIPDGEETAQNPYQTNPLLIDTDDDGYIDKSEFIKFSKNLSKEQVEKAWSKLDKDGDGN